MIMENLISLVSLAISLFTLIFSIFIYKKHGKRLDLQQEELNAFQISKYNEEKTLSRCANITGELISNGRGKVSFIVTNTGKDIARNIRINIINCPNCIILSDITNINSLGPNKTWTFTLHLSNGCPTFFTFKYTWDDGYAENREITEDIKVP